MPDPEETEREAQNQAEAQLEPHLLRVARQTNYGSEEISVVHYWEAVKLLTTALAARRLSESEPRRQPFPAGGPHEFVHNWLEEDAKGFVIPNTEWGRELLNSLQVILYCSPEEVIQ